MRIAQLRAGASMKLAAATMFAVFALLMAAGGARAAGGVDVRTPSLDFGRAVVGTTATTTKYIELHNGTPSTLQLTSMQLGGGIFDFTPNFADGTTCPTPDAGALAGVAPGATCQVTVTFTPQAFGPLSGSLEITFCAVDANPCVPITTSGVSLAGQGVHADALTLAPTGLTFTSTPPGTSSPTQTVTLTNGSEPMSISGLTLGGSAPADFAIQHDGCTGAELAPGATCSFDVSFIPGQAGSRSASVTVIGATAGNSYPTLTLSGDATGSAASTPGTPANPAVLVPPGVPTGPTAPAHRTGPARSSLSLELITCQARAHKQQCSAKLIAGPLTFTAKATTAQATVSRGRVVYAAGPATAVGPGRWALVMRKRRALRPGLYTLTLRSRHATRHLLLRIS